MKIANKADSAFDIANKTKPLLETTPVKMVSTILSHVGVYMLCLYLQGMVLDPYLTAKAKLEREEKEKQLEEEKKALN